MWLAAALAWSIAAGIAVDWWPRFAGTAVLYVSVLATAGVCVWTGRAWRFPVAAVFAAVIGLWGWLQVAASWSVAPFATRAGALEWSVAAAAFLAACQILRGSSARWFFLDLVMWMSVVFSVQAVVERYSAPSLVLWMFPAGLSSPFGTFSYKNQFAAMLQLAVPIALFRMLFKADYFRGGAALLALMAGVIASGSRAGVGLVAAECVAVVFLAWRAGKIRLAVLLGGLPVAAALLAGIAALAGNEMVFGHYKDLRSDAVRVEFVKATVSMIKNEPWVGYGLGTWSFVYPKYAVFDNGLWSNVAHNDWLEWTAEGGFVFAGSFAALLLALGRKAHRHPWSLGVFALAVHSWVDYPTREPVVAVMWFCIAGGLAAASMRSEREGSSREHGL